MGKRTDTAIDWKRLDWWRILQWPLLLASAGVAAWVSYTQQRQLGIYVGWDSPWGLPIILDGLAAATLLSYIRKPTKFNRTVSTLVIATAVAGNAQAAIYDPDTAALPAPLWAVIAWKVLPPVAVFTIAHYIASERKEALDAVGTELVEPARGDTGDPGHARANGTSGADRPVEAVPQQRGLGAVDTPTRPRNGIPAHRNPPTRRTSTRKSDAELVAQVRDHGWLEVSGDELAKRLSVAKGRALDVRRQARNGSVAVS